MTGPLLIATRSAGKRKEIVQILRDVPYRLVFPDDVGLAERAEEQRVETADSFEGNARRKAEYFSRWSGLPTAADLRHAHVLHRSEEETALFDAAVRGEEVDR